MLSLSLSSSCGFSWCCCLLCTAPPGAGYSLAIKSYRLAFSFHQLATCRNGRPHWQFGSVADRKLRTYIRPSSNFLFYEWRNCCCLSCSCSCCCCYYFSSIFLLLLAPKKINNKRKENFWKCLPGSIVSSSEARTWSQEPPLTASHLPTTPKWRPSPSNPGAHNDAGSARLSRNVFNNFHILSNHPQSVDCSVDVASASRWRRKKGKILRRAQRGKL